MNYNKPNITRQAQDSKKPLSTPNIDTLIQLWSLERIRVLKFVLNRWKDKTCGNDTYGYVALCCNVSQSTVRRVFSDLRDMGLAEWDYVHLRPNNFFLAQFLFTSYVVEKLTKALTVFGVFTLSFLISKERVVLPEHHLINNEVIYKQLQAAANSKSNYEETNRARAYTRTHVRETEQPQKGTSMINEKLHARLKKSLQAEEHDITALEGYPTTALEHGLKTLLAAEQKKLINNKMGYFLAAVKGFCVDRRLPINGQQPTESDSEAQPSYKTQKREMSKQPSSGYPTATESQREIQDEKNADFQQQQFIGKAEKLLRLGLNVTAFSTADINWLFFKVKTLRSAGVWAVGLDFDGIDERFEALRVANSNRR